MFYKNAKDEIFHTYGAFGRGDEQFMGIFRFFDVLPKGREEYGPHHSLPDWAKFMTNMRTTASMKRLADACRTEVARPRED
jgi:predicted dithiol-disulfide oxidoreductase (DUF899 family)